MGNDVGNAGQQQGSGGGVSWEPLQKLAWCPVLLAPPHPDLPWAPAGSRLAPPRMARPVRKNFSAFTGVSLAHRCFPCPGCC